MKYLGLIMISALTIVSITHGYAIPREYGNGLQGARELAYDTFVDKELAGVYGSDKDPSYSSVDQGHDESYGVNKEDYQGYIGEGRSENDDNYYQEYNASAKGTYDENQRDDYKDSGYGQSSNKVNPYVGSNVSYELLYEDNNNNMENDYQSEQSSSYGDNHEDEYEEKDHEENFDHTDDVDDYEEDYEVDHEDDYNAEYYTYDGQYHDECSGALSADASFAGSKIRVCLKNILSGLGL